jgi:hypothetical protein
LKQFPVEVVSVRSAKESSHVPDNDLMKEFMKRHFPRATFTVLKGVSTVDVPGYIKDQKENCLIALGAYSRGNMSRWLKESMADILMRDLKVPLFIAHSK